MISTVTFHAAVAAEVAGLASSVRSALAADFHFLLEDGNLPPKREPAPASIDPSHAWLYHVWILPRSGIGIVAYRDWTAAGLTILEIGLPHTLGKAEICLRHDSLKSEEPHFCWEDVLVLWFSEEERQQAAELLLMERAHLERKRVLAAAYRALKTDMGDLCNFSGQQLERFLRRYDFMIELFDRHLQTHNAQLTLKIEFADGVTINIKTLDDLRLGTEERQIRERRHI